MQKKKAQTLIIGLTPAWQKTLKFSNLQKGKVNRVKETFIETTGGKGVNFAKAFKRHGGNSLIAQFLGGETGKLILKNLKSQSLENITVRTSCKTRLCTTLLCKKTESMTEIIEPTAAVSKEEISKLYSAIINVLPKVSGIAICGTYPKGIKEDFFIRIFSHTKKQITFLDAYKNIENLLINGIDILKINVDELKALTFQKDFKKAVSICFEKYNIGTLALTDGPSKAYLFYKNKEFTFSIPKLKSCMSTLGAGDTASAIFFKCILDGFKYEDAFCEALACATASCLNDYPTLFETKIAKKIKKGIRITEHFFEK